MVGLNFDLLVYPILTDKTLEYDGTQRMPSILALKYKSRGGIVG